MSIQSIFPEFVYNEVLDIDNNEIINYCLLCKDSIPSRTISNIGGWQSNNIQDDELLSTPLRGLAELLRKRFLLVFNYVGYKTSGKQVHLDAWININGSGHSNSPHVHQNSMLSGVYYPKVPEKSGNLMLYRSIDPTFVKFKSELFDHLNNPYTNNVAQFVPKEKSLIIFPSHLRHAVDVNNSEENRISIAFNSVVF